MSEPTEASSAPTADSTTADSTTTSTADSTTTSTAASTAPADPPASPPSLASRITKPEADSHGDSKKLEEKAVEPKIDQTDGAGEPMGGSSLQEPEYSVDVKLSDMQMDPNNPLYSARSFDELGLNADILKGIYQMNFRKPSKIQERALPLLMLNPPMNMIGQSQSGTGKTAAFVLNILSRVDLSNRNPQGLVLAPSRELARQILGVVQIMGSFMSGLETCLAVPAEAAERAAKLEGHVVVGTPGTVMDKIKRRQMNPTHLKVLVLDEADNMLDQQGLGDQCIRVKLMLPKTIQVVLFSATFPNKVVQYAGRFAPNANQITLRHEELTVEGIKQLYLDCPGEESKYDILVKLYGLMTIGSSIIFVKRRDTAVEIERRMVAQGHHVASLTGAFEGAARDTIIDSFRSGKAKVLITTNVLARGIDVQSVSMVINYDIPDDIRGNADPQTYLHRIGRTGRFGRVGVSISFVYDQKSWQQLMTIQQYFNCEMVRIDTNDWDNVEDVVQHVLKSSRAGVNFQNQ